MISIKRLLEERNQFPFGIESNYKMINHIEKKKENESAFISHFVDHLPLKNFQIAGVYGLGNIYRNYPHFWYIVHLSKKPVTKIKFARYIRLLKAFIPFEHLRLNDKFILLDNYPERWKQYCDLLEKWINGGNIPSSNNWYEFVEIPQDKIINNSYYPLDYTRKRLNYVTS